MEDDLLWILNEFLKDESWKHIINLEISTICQKIHPNVLQELEDAKREGNDIRIEELSLKEKILRYNNYNRDTFLHVVARSGTVETALQLLKGGADANVENSEGNTPIFYAMMNSAEMVKVLLNDSRVHNWDLFRDALIHGSEETFRLLVFKSLLEIQNDSTQDSISTIHSNTDEFPNTMAMINTFLQLKLHLSHMEASYPLLIFFAARICKKDILHTILNDCKQNLSSIKQKQIKGNRRYESRDPEELNVQGPSGEAALHYAVANQHVQAAQFLLEEGADPNCQDVFSLTPLHSAVYLKNEEICQLLFDFKANPNLSRVNLLSLVCNDDSAKTTVRSRMYNYGNYNSDVPDSGFNVEIMKLLLQNGADPNAKDAGNPVLFKACENNLLEGTKILVEYGANIRALNCGIRQSVLHQAVRNHSFDIVDFLLEKGHDIDPRDNNRNTPLLFEMMKRKPSLAMIENLVHRGANVNAVNVQGQSALHIALFTNKITKGLVEHLLKLGADWSVLNIDKIKINCASVDEKQLLISVIALRSNDLREHYISILENPTSTKNAYEYFQKSRNEITKLKEKSISKNLRQSYFDFLTKNFYNSVQIAKNLDFRSFLNSNNCENEFPCYDLFLKSRFKLAQDSEIFVDKTFNFILNYTHLMPEIVEVIMSNLRLTDFQVFAEALSNKQF